MRDPIPSVEKEFALREQDFGLHRLRLGCILAAALTPPGSLIDLMMFDDKVNSSVSLGALFGFRVLCSAGVVPIFLLSYQPFAAKYFRLLGVALAFAPAFCMAGIIAVTEGSMSGYYVGMILVLLGVGVVMQWTRRQTSLAAGMVLILYLMATLVGHDVAWAILAKRRAPAPIFDSSFAIKGGDLSDPRYFVEDLRDGSDPISLFLRAQMDTNTLGALSTWRGTNAPDNALVSGLLREVNRLSHAEKLWTKLDPNSMANILGWKGMSVINRKNPKKKEEIIPPTPQQQAGLNRLILGDIYPRSIMHNPYVIEAVLGRIWPTLGMHCWFLLLTSIIIVIGNHFSTELRYSDFVARHKLDLSRREAELTNERLEEVNRRLRELDQLKDNFFANVSHELRTPLTLLLGPVEHLQRHPRVVEDDRLRDFVTTMHDNGMRLLKLINDLLDLVRLQAKALVLKPAPINVSTYAGKLVGSIRGYAEDRGLKLLCNVHPDLGTVVWDEAKIDKVFLNLLFNGIKFTPAGGEVSWHAWRDGEEAVVEVRDTGVGISLENQRFLFQRFWQADSSSQRKHQGAGIGLALVKELVEAHGGSVTVRSKLGQGTTVMVRLPLVSTSGPAKTAPSSPPASAADAVNGNGIRNGKGHGAIHGPGHGDGTEVRSDTTPGEQEAEAARLETQRHLDELYRRAEMHASITPLRQNLRPWVPAAGHKNRPQVLVVDDEPGIRRFLKDQLQEDYQVHEAVDGQQGVELARQYIPDAVVCDMMLPEKDGMEVCRDLRNYHTTRLIPFLMLTARADDETKLTALAAGASDFLVKPFRTEELKLRIKNLVDARRLERELAQQNKKLQSTLAELKETEMQLVQSEKMGALGRLVAGIIHEINNPLNFARTGIHVLGTYSKTLPAAEQPDFLEVVKDISDGITRVSGIVGELRQFSHPDNDALHEVDAPAAAAAALRFMAAEWKDARAEVVNEIPPGFLVRGNKNKLVQVFINMFQNAFDAMRSHPPQGDKPRLHLKAWEEGGVRRISIRDNGPGVSDEHVAHIFEPFFTTKDVGKGMGLGLSICFRILEEAGGRIVINTEKGRYCEFVLEFPATTG
jgi:signal transduction histidine kinase